MCSLFEHLPNVKKLQNFELISYQVMGQRDYQWFQQILRHFTPK